MVSSTVAAGAHYVGDGSQPLHDFRVRDSDPSRTVTRHHPNAGAEDKQTDTVPFAKSVRRAYESNIVAFKADKLIAKVKARLPAVPGLLSVG